MCTLVLLRRPKNDWPLVLALNRDEKRSRKWASPSRHWKDRRHVVGGLDHVGGGSWLAINDSGLIAAVLNRRGSLGPLTLKRSRGELPLEAVDHVEAKVAAQQLSMIKPDSYGSFNLIIADARDAFWLKSSGSQHSSVEIFSIPEGVSMITASDLNDYTCPRIEFNLAKFQKAQAPNPGSKNWNAWQKLLSCSKLQVKNGAKKALNLVGDSEYGTVSSSLIGVPKSESTSVRPVWMFSSGSPQNVPYEIVDF